MFTTIIFKPVFVLFQKEQAILIEYWSNFEFKMIFYMKKIHNNKNNLFWPFRSLYLVLIFWGFLLTFLMKDTQLSFTFWFISEEDTHLGRKKLPSPNYLLCYLKLVFLSYVHLLYVTYCKEVIEILVKCKISLQKHNLIRLNLILVELVWFFGSDWFI